MKQKTYAAKVVSNSSSSRALLKLAFWLAAAAIGSQTAQAQLTTLHAFAGSPDGAESSSGLIRDKSGNFYGTTSAGGTGQPFGGAGTVFKMDAKGKVTVLYSFCPSEPCTDGSYPLGGLAIDKAGNLYGTTNTGGDFNAGTVFKVTASGQQTVLYSFKGFSQGDGDTPGYGTIWLDSGGLYGTTTLGGSSCSFSGGGCGTIWNVDLSGNETVLYRFTGTDGATPVAGVIRDNTGNIYGTTSAGGSKGCGVVFQLVPGPGILTVLHDFCTGADGSVPVAGVLIRGNNLYGTTQSGGMGGCGTVYKVTIPTGTTTLHSFGFDGCFPSFGGLIFDVSKNFVYGTTASGGASGFGTIFKVAVDGSSSQVIYNFTGGNDGGTPYGGLLHAGHNLDGTTFGFGASGWGTVFKIAAR